ncbi:hypothetical protein SCUCBS95973_008096 [Sporothrix curviconia]|uniref:Xylanolytic transcriptional activator regulatory domain-containing protein n=1 Tax=Sporothrix curviconia TaxID=1260050 RepID=A0ABP0CJA8_9PEZI
MAEQADAHDVLSGGHKRAANPLRQRPGQRAVLRLQGCPARVERKIDQFEARLAGIEGLLQGLNASLSSRAGTDDNASGRGSSSGGGMRTYTSPSGLSDANTAYDEQQPPTSMSTPGRASKHTRSHTHAAGTPSTPPSTGGDDPCSLFDGGPASFEGTSSMAAQTAYASEFVEQAVTGGHTPMQMDASAANAIGDGDMQKALAALRRMAQQQHKQQQHRGKAHASRSPSSHFSRQKPVPRGGVCQLPLPPSDVVLKLLREIRATPPMAFNMSCSFLNVSDFIEACRDVYFATEDFGLSRFIIVNGGLYYLFEEKAAVHKSSSGNSSASSASSAERDLCAKYQRLCGDNVETALANLPLFLPPSGEMVEALVLGVTYAIENSKFTLAWQLNSAAAAMCQTLGWHHAAAPDSFKGPDCLRPGAFWFCYMIDKGLALRFGRTCALPDWDISTPRDFCHGESRSHNNNNDNNTGSNSSPTGADQDPAALHGVFNVWIRTGDILGQTYEHLYSPAALARSPQERADTARRLGLAAKQIWGEFETLSSTALEDGEVPQDWRRSTLKRVLLSGQVGHLATLTLIYRAIPFATGPSSSLLSPNSSLHAECVAAARGAFRSHQACMALASDDPLALVGHLHWTVLYSPFTPLTVLFCHVIETASRLRQTKGSLVVAMQDEITSDLAHLETFAASLQPLLALSPAIARMYGLSRLLHQLAALYVQAKQAENDTAAEVAGAAAAAGASEVLVSMEQRESQMPTPMQMQIDSTGIRGLGTDLDLYLSQLGFLPDPNSTVMDLEEAASVPPTFTAVENTNVGAVIHPGAVIDSSSIQPRLDDWFSRNTYVMGLVEDDLFDFGWDQSTAGGSAN